MYLFKNRNRAYFAFGILVLLQLILSSCGKYEKQPPTKSLERNVLRKAAKLEELIGLYTDYEGFNGTVLIAQEGKIVYKNGFGLANMEWDIPNTADTKFRIASITKPFTSLLIMQLVAENKVALHEPIGTYLPNYPKENGEQVTIHHLLSHTSGVVREYGKNKKLNSYPDKQRVDELVDEFSSLPLEFTPGERFEYSNSGYMVLGYLIERVTGKTYETVLQEKILNPIGMKNTGVDKHRPLIKKRAKGYFNSFGTNYNANYIDISSIPAVGNLYSTVEDLFLLDQALYDQRLLPKKYLDLLFTKHAVDKNYGGHHGYGWELKEKPIGNTGEVIKTIGHSGVIDGFCGLFTRIPSNNSTIILLNNTRRAYLNSITKAAIGILHDKPYDFPKKPLAKFMSEIIEREGVEKGVLFYKKHKDQNDYYIDETELIVAGYRLLHAGKAKDAAEVFKLSIEVFPTKDNPYDSYAEALMALGKNEEAIVNYKKSLEINPNNNNAKKMLLKLEQ